MLEARTPACEQLRNLRYFVAISVLLLVNSLPLLPGPLLTQLASILLAISKWLKYRLGDG
jgi:hypothetical protein